MKSTVKPGLLKLLTLCAGGLGLMLRVILYTTGVDHKGLLITGHWAAVSLWILTAVMAAVMLLLSRCIQGPQQYRDAHPASFTAFVGAFAAAAAAAYCAVTELGTCALGISILSFAAALSLAVIGICRLAGKRVLFLCHVILCAFFALRMISQYKLWNSDPQLQDYVFYLSAYVALMLNAYQHASFDASQGSHGALWCTGLLAVYLCCVALMGAADTWLLLGAGIWAFTNLTNLNVRRRPKYGPREEV